MFTQHVSAGDFDLKITLGFEISKSTVHSRLIHISLLEEVGPLSSLAGGILLSNTPQYAHGPVHEAVQYKSDIGRMRSNYCSASESAADVVTATNVKSREPARRQDRTEV